MGKTMKLQWGLDKAGTLDWVNDMAEAGKITDEQAQALKEAIEKDWPRLDALAANQQERLDEPEVDK